MSDPNNHTPMGNNTNNTASMPNDPPHVPLTQGTLNPGLYGVNPAAGSPVNKTIFEIVGELMTPPEQLRYPQGKVTLNIAWAVGVAGPERFERTALGHRHSLIQNDDLNIHGPSAGLYEEVRQWLRFGEDTLELDANHFGL